MKYIKVSSLKRLVLKVVMLLTVSMFFFYNALAQYQPDSVFINIILNQTSGEMYPMWAYFGYDEPNYTYMANGKKLLTEISELSSVPVFLRAHNLLNTDENGSRAAIKWGSTNAYTEDEDGNPVYDWEIVDRIIDTYINRGMKPLVEVGFMPKALSSKPEPYRHYWQPGDNYGDIYTGWSYPPNDYEKWSELIFQWVRHSVDRYGKEEVESWWWELWNEPNIGYWQGTKAEYFKLYDYTVDAIHRALPTAKVGGPTTTGPRWGQAAGWLRDFLEHCQSDTNAVTGEIGTPLDFISYHAKGSPREIDGHVRMNMGVQLEDVSRGFEIVASFPAYKDLPIIIGEADPEGCAACSFASGYRGNGYRNGVMYSSYTASSFAKMYDLADEHGVNFEGALSWSFEFENQPWFDGFRSMATNGIDKPVLNIFRMFGMMKGDRVIVSQDHPITPSEVIENGIHGDQPDINALASTQDNTAWIMVWNYHDDDLLAPDSPIAINVNGISGNRALVQHYRVDKEHSNAFTAWRNMGAPQQVTRDQYEKLENAGQLELLTSPQWKNVSENGEVSILFSLPRQGVSFLQITW